MIILLQYVQVLFNTKLKYYKKTLPNNGKINWHWKGKKIFNFIRSMTFEPFSPPYFYIGKKKYIIIAYYYLSINASLFHNKQNFLNILLFACFYSPKFNLEYLTVIFENRYSDKFSFL